MPVSVLMPWRRPSPSGEINKYLFLLLFLFFVLWMPATALAQAAKVVDVHGTSLVERAGAAPRILGAGEPLDARDTISVARDSWAILEFSDQTRVTLRPNTVFRLDSYKADAPEAMLMGLVRGGLRVVTGFFGKRNPQGVRVQTAVATIGIRGTEFDARLCGDDCREENTQRGYRLLPPVVARVIEMRNVVAAGAARRPDRFLVPGAAVYEGDAIAAGPSGYAVLAFVDGARVSIGARSGLRIEHFRFDEPGNKGYAKLVVIGGKVGVRTGRLAQLSPTHFRVLAPVGEIRPRGTAFLVQSPPLQLHTPIITEVNSTDPAKSVPVSAEVLNFLRAMISRVNSNADFQVTMAGIANQAAAKAAETDPNSAEAIKSRMDANAETFGQAFGGGGGRVESEANSFNNLSAAIAGSTSSNPGQGAASNAVTPERQTDGPGKYDINLVGLGATATAQELLTAMLSWHAAFTTHPVYGSEFADLPLPSLADISDVARLGAVLQSWFKMIDAHDALGRGFEEIDARPIGMGSGPPVLAPATPSAPPVEAPATATPENVQRLDIVDSQVIDVLRRLEATIEGNSDTRREAYFPTGIGLDGKPTYVYVGVIGEPPIDLPSIPANATSAEVLRILTEWHQQITSHGVWGGQLAGMRAPTESDVSDPARMGALLSQWFTQLDGSTLGNGLEKFSTGSLFANPLASSQQLPAAERARPQVEARHVDLEAGPAAPSSGTQSLDQIAEVRRGGPQASTPVITSVQGAPMADAILVLLDAMILTATNNAMRHDQGNSMARSKGLTADDVAALRLAFRQGASTPSEILELMRGWHDALTRHPNYGGHFAELPFPTSADLADPGRMAALLRTWFTLLDSHPVLGEGYEEINASVIGLNPSGTQQAMQFEKPAGVPGQPDSGPTSTDTGMATAGNVSRPLFDPRAVDLLRRLESILEENSDTAVRGASGGIIAGALPFSLPSIPLGASPEEALSILREWRSSILMWLAEHPNMNVQMVNLFYASRLPMPTEADVTDPQRLGVLLSQWFTFFGGLALGEGLEGFNTGGLFVNPLAPYAQVIPLFNAIAVSEGAVDVVDPGGTQSVEAGTLLARSRDFSFSRSRYEALSDMIDKLHLASIDPDLFRDTDKPIEEGLYVWVRDGAVQVTKDNQSIDVSAGNAAVATKDRVRLLDAVPNFMRFDPTPVPNLSLTARLDAFRLPDGALQNMCVIR
ncbi:MAG: FecR domain-containing protein [Burkholderiales bacterium]|nr:FecR domain-containing protein [Burkholderiales bacterium]